VRATAGHAGGDELLRTEFTQGSGHVAGHVRDPPAGPRCGQPVAGPGAHDGAQAARRGRLRHGLQQDQPARRSVVQDERQAAGRARGDDLQPPAAGGGEGELIR
jgi:hypothetical protein